MTTPKFIERDYDVMNIANYVVVYALRIGKPISNLLLQKVLYYLYVDYLVNKNIKLFNEPIEKWGYGPVLPDVYHNFKSNGISSIQIPAPIMIEGGEKEEGDIDLFGTIIKPFNSERVQDSFVQNGDDISYFEKIVKDYLDEYSERPFALVEKTHSEPMWMNRKEDIEAGVRNLQYSDEEIFNYFVNR
ncbi:DUF4065 domain-containing protein [Fructobacillus sp. M1-13]|uniref:DUF4065 domain-containing protein n=1 Tax=Fructobacillus papyriferae TaxID=2713171 RepID=A0ABS5QRF5_9LACO|nr:type II toxin-antitoxin system antitoxin SocA domain-containing protein [Fructobacillus papyriferae]MBS9334904.1 DUF4065 domain-containing protein [Fructobacillus papyriferae]MCD2159612.1 DUF4065 domain-containing protein [Fructobacillus papyriferae]